MNRRSILLGIGLAGGAFALTLISLRAQQPGSSGKGGGGEAQLGDNVTIIVPEGTITSLAQDLVITGPPKPAKAVGSCTSVGSVASDPSLTGRPAATVQFQDANLVDRTQVNLVWREAATPKAKTEVAIVFRGYAGFKELTPGWHLGKWRTGGKCGPGYEAYVGYIVAGAPGGVSQSFQ